MFDHSLGDCIRQDAAPPSAGDGQRMPLIDLRMAPVSTPDRSASEISRLTARTGPPCRHPPGPWRKKPRRDRARPH